MQSVTGETFAPARGWGESALWGGAAIAAGVVAGVAAAAFDARTVVLALLAVVVPVMVLWRYEIGAVLLMLTLPLDEFGRIITQPVTVTIFHVVLLLTLASWGLAFAWRPETRLRFSAVDVGMGALLFAAVWTLPFSLAPGASVIAIVRLAFLWLFTLFFANVMSTQRVLDWVVAGLVATGFFSALLAIAQYFVPGFDYGNVRLVNSPDGLIRRVGALFYDPNYFAGFLSVVLMVTIAYLIRARSWTSAVSWAVASGTLALALLISYSRTGLVGVGVGVIVLLLTAPPKRRIWLFAALVASVIAVVSLAPGAILSRVESIADPGADRSIATRVQMAVSSVQMIEDNWAVGTGLEGFEVAYPAYRELGSRTDILQPHQLPLAIWAEMGLPGLLAELLLIGALIVQFRPVLRGGWTVAQSFSAAGLVCVLVSSLFQNFLYFEYLWLFVAFAVAANRLAAERSDTVSVSIEQPVFG